jgi:hypothetical protein
MNAIAMMIEEVYTDTTGVAGITYTWFMEGRTVQLIKSEWTMDAVGYTTRWNYPTVAEFSAYLEGQHAMHLQNGWTHEVFS